MFYDLDENPVTNFRFPLRPNQTEPMSFKLDCEDGRLLRCSLTADIEVRGKHVSESEFVDMIVDGIDLTPWAGTIQQFDLEFEVGDIEEYELDDFQLYLS